MKKLRLLFAAAAFSLITCFTSFAGEWKQDAVGWWYDNGDSTCARDGWHWIDGKCYYFTAEGYCLMNTATPDGYMVDSNGAWIIDGVVQIQDSLPSETIYTIGTLRISAPNGFALIGQYSDYCTFGTDDHRRAAAVYCSEVGVDPHMYFNEDYINSVLDNAMINQAGAYTSKASIQLANGTWNCYHYDNANVLEVPGTMTAYLRMDGSYMQMALFAGYISDINTDEIMNAIIH